MELENDIERDWYLDFKYNGKFLNEGGLTMIRQKEFANFLLFAVPWTLFDILLQWLQFVKFEKHLREDHELWLLEPTFSFI